MHEMSNSFKIIFKEKVIFRIYCSCTDPICRKSYLRREFSEIDASTEISFIRKLIHERKENLSTTNVLI